ncbi:hypothetical protein CASFOL_012490 [Castilleja foliolosa]|uniref:UvrD-like helicase ATP-binding domain-containing protein n=1 Tax=Castilleja foliolosa TaxID=1961234 RepID=A0ABD3DH79_9LAMI
MYVSFSRVAWNGSNENLSIGLISPYAAQVAAIRDRLRQKLFKAWNGMNEDQSIGLISPYAAQVTAIQEWFPHMYENLEGFTVEVSTDYGFQNGEKDIIIISTAGSHNCGSVGFLLGPQGTNVALTRARHSLWIVGDEKALSLSDSVWEALILDAKRRQCFFSADEDYDIGKTIVKVKEGLQELEDLFGGGSVLFNNSRWKVLFSDSFFKSFLKLKSFYLKNPVICKLRMLAHGWRPNNINQDLVCKGSSYIVKQFKVDRNLSIVCSVDIIEDSVYKQVLKVWDLLLHMEETPTLLRRLDNITSMYTDDFISHCNEKLLEGNVQVPKSWPLSESIIKFKNRNSFKNSSDGTVDGHIEKSEVSECLLLMKFYSLSTGMSNYFLTDLEGRELDLPYEVTSEERKIIMFPNSSFILGRSGMEKTNILTMKLFKNFQQYHIASQDSRVADDNSVQTNSTPLRQLFITVNSKQCYAVKKHVSHLKSFASGNLFGNSNFIDMDDIEEMTAFKDIPDTLVGIQLDNYPLIITFHKFIMMLDGTIGNSYAERLHNVRNVQSSRRSESLVALKTFIRKNEVTHDRFRSFYWPHFNAKLIKNLDPSIVFTEIISHIKGSLPKGGTCDDSIRSREEYTSLSHRRVSNLSAEKRDIIYDIFHDYEKMKLKRGEFDLADFVIDVHLRLKNENPMVDKMDFVYIDEAQELTMRQIALLRCICKNVGEGIVFSGETAQTIIGGINSRSHFVCENNEVFPKPMLDYWKSLSAVQVIKVDDSFANELQRESSPEELKSMAIKLFWEKKYAMATKCFERAGEDTWGKWAKASGLRDTSDALRGSNPNRARIMLREAAEIFDSIDRVDSAAECFCELGEYERAGRIYMKKSGTSELRKAGECFSLVGHHKIAADVYAKGYFFKECLTSCARGKYFDLGLQYIEDWNCETVDKFALEFLKKCPSKYFRTKDNASLLRLVQFFHTKESKRNCLMSLDRLDLLLNLEVKSGNLYEAAEIAELLGDIMCAVDLLEKSEQFGKASSLVLSNVLSSSLWVSGTQGWPLKKFPQKDELLTKAMSASRKVSGTFHTSVCAEAQILSHERTILSELARCYNASKEYKNCTAEILSVRKLLDAHFEVDPADYEWDTKLRIDPRLFDERISCSRVSGGTLLYVWNLWKDHSLEILDCINSLKSVDRPARCTDKGIVQFCLNYFGVRLQHNSDIISYLLLKPNASWVRRSVGKWSKVLTIDADCFALVARNYWHQELVSVGFRVLEVFRALHEFSVAKMPLSMYCQGLCLTSVYDVTRFFIESNSLDMNESDKEKLHAFLKLSTTKYFELVFPLDSRRSLSGNLISLRETETSCDLLSEIISDKIKIGLGLRYGEMGRVVIMLLGSGKLNHYVYLKSAESFNECSSSWISLIRNINSAQVDLGHLLHQALAETCDNANWRGKMDYISPNCFFYVVERLLILVTYSQGFFLAMKSSFVEYLISLPSDADPSAHFVTYEKSYSERIFDFVDSVVQQCLFSIHDSTEWINNSGIDYEYYFPVLMLRLVMILCLSCLNSELSFNVILKLLGIPQIRSQLPSEFCEALLQERTNDDSSYIVAVIALALEVVGDPLVIVCSGGTRPEFVCPPDAVFVDLKSFSCRNEILKALVSSTESFEIGVPPVVSDQQVNLEVNWDLIHEISESLELLRNRNDGDFKSLVLKKKEEMEDYLRFLTDATSQIIEQRYFYGEDKNELTEAAGMIEELNRLFSLSETSEFDSEVISEIGRLLKDLEAKRVELDRLVSLFSMQSDPNGNVIVCPLVNCVRRKSEELLAAPANCISAPVAECSQGKGKGKKYNNKSRKGKKGGRRK